MVLPSQQLLEKVSQQITSIPNKQGEYKRKIHYGCYLLGYKSGLRISEAIKLDLSTKTHNDLYRIEKPKGQKERYVYIPKEVIIELKENNWQPNQTNRFAFYQFLKKVKKELNISKNIELTPHTLRRAFTTYHAEAGLPLPLLQKLLGHSSIRTTALYWRNIHGNNNAADILAGKKWLENRKSPETPTENIPIGQKENILKNPEPPIIRNKPRITEQKPIIRDNSPPSIFIEPKAPERLLPNISETNQQPEISEQLPIITKREEILLAKIKRLEGQLKEVQTENDNLTVKLSTAEAIAKQEKQRADNYQQQLKTIAKAFQQWQKINYYQQLEQEQEIQTQIIQAPPFKPNK